MIAKKGTVCVIDHSDPETIPRNLCRICSEGGENRPYHTVIPIIEAGKVSEEYILAPEYPKKDMRHLLVRACNLCHKPWGVHRSMYACISAGSAVLCEPCWERRRGIAEAAFATKIARSRCIEVLETLDGQESK
jgi:hypothetical protein